MLMSAHAVQSLAALGLDPALTDAGGSCEGLGPPKKIATGGPTRSLWFERNNTLGDEKERQNGNFTGATGARS
jgi:hypothetical protein